MYHELNLYDKPFKLVKANYKTIELRLNDEKRRQIRKGDLIKITNLLTLEEIFVQVLELYKFKSFKELYDNLDLKQCGYLKEELDLARPEDMLEYYSYEQQEKHGVVGIKLEVLDVLEQPKTVINDSLTDNEITLKLNAITKANKLKGYVPAYKYDIYLANSDEKIGFIDIRLGYHENIIYGGNIGYIIHENYRGNSYAKKATRLIFEVAKAFKMKKIFITCNPNNIPSKKTIENLGFTLIRKVNLPKYNEMYLTGDREKLIYELTINDR